MDGKTDASNQEKTAMMLPVQDEREIVELINRYATAIDTNDYELFRTCWADKIDVDYLGPGLKWSTGDDITEFMREVHKPTPVTMHMNSNITLTPDGDDRAKGRTYVKAILIRADGTTFLRFDGWYNDGFAKLSGSWKITRRRLHTIRQEQYAE